MQNPAPEDLERFVAGLAIPGSYPWKYDLVASQPEIVAFIRQYTGAAHVDRPVEGWDAIPHEINSASAVTTGTTAALLKFIRSTINMMREDRATYFGLLVFAIDTDIWTLTARWDNHSGRPRDYGQPSDEVLRRFGLT